MDFWTFTSKVIEAVAWPGVVLFLVLKFRQQFASLLGRVTEATFPGNLSAKFGPALETAGEVADELPEPVVPADDEIKPAVKTETDSRIIQSNPSGVIMEMWQKVLGTAKELLDSHVGQIVPNVKKRPLPPQTLFRLLQENNLVTPDEMTLVAELRSIRNAVAHSQTQATPEDADRYRAFAEKLILTWVVRIANGEPRQ